MWGLWQQDNGKLSFSSSLSLSLSLSLSQRKLGSENFFSSKGSNCCATVFWGFFLSFTTAAKFVVGLQYTYFQWPFFFT
jgi:hypothetical protein